LTDPNFEYKSTAVTVQAHNWRCC